MATLNKKYAIGTHIMFYEIDMYKEFIDGLLNMLQTVDNKDNVYIDLCLNLLEYLEEIDLDIITIENIVDKFNEGISRLKSAGVVNLCSNILYSGSPIYYHTDYRRDLNYKYSKIVNYVIWGETDSFMPKEGLLAIESLAQYTDEQNIYRYIMSFSDRKLWDESWNPTVHEDYINHKFEDGPDSHLHPMQAKSVLSINEMNNINAKIDNFNFIAIPYTKIDGSFLVISSELIKSGVNIPPCMLYNDDEGLAVSFDQLYGPQNKILQFICKNLLKVHARRHPNKRMYVKNERNSYSFADKKNNIFHTFKKLSENNLRALRTTEGKFYNYDDLLNLT